MAEYERMTKRDIDGRAVMDCKKCKADWMGKYGKPMVECTALYCRNRLKDRLAAYEDTRLTPSDVHSLWGEWDAMMSVLNSIGGGYERLRELAEADKAGRAVILPCKVGDAVWILQRRLDGSCCVRATEFWWSDIPQVGKTVFLSSEEAEKALEASEDG